ncbi:hypothetical protein KUTeg_013423 [Tegillarca granosa]|uniref:DNA polymerase alpha subunit B n=1 Tax=Tegillarca granosa TaxID=220873 RepID=A0ABQ9EU03_TEGGR|nr:hypothetical protein KUTeg_013423 [Tegillarca granosa]
MVVVSVKFRKYKHFAGKRLLINSKYWVTKMATVSEGDLSDEFSFFGIEIEDKAVVEKLQELCAVYRQDASQIAAEWTAYSQTKKGVLLNLENLNMLDRERLVKKTPKTPLAKKEKVPVIYDINSIQKGIDENDAEQLYNAYSGTTPKPSQKRQHTPENIAVKRFTNSVRSPVVPFSPASYSPAGKFVTRSNAGEVVFSYGNLDNVSWQGQGCTICHYGNMEVMTSQFKYMFQKLTEKANVLNDMIEDMARQLEKYHNIEEISHLALPIQSVPLPLPEVSKTETESGQLSILVAAGPFTTSDNLSYEPLVDLMKYLTRDKPDVCILLGPFVDAKNEEIEKGNCKVTYEEVFISNLKHVENVSKSCGTQVVVVPSYRDVHHDNVYPQPPFFDEKTKGGNKAGSSHMHFVSDPCTLAINNVVFGITSADILFHIGAEEISL